MINCCNNRCLCKNDCQRYQFKESRFDGCVGFIAKSKDDPMPLPAKESAAQRNLERLAGIRIL